MVAPPSQGYFRAVVPRAARSHSASVGNRQPVQRRFAAAQAQNAFASYQLTPTTGRLGYWSCSGQPSGSGESWPPACHQLWSP